MSRQIFITQSDKNRLLEIIHKTKYEDLKDNLGLQDLEAEINRAVVTSVEQLPANIITMNTEVVLLIEDAEEVFRLVYPNEADILQNKISVLSPIGTAILGYSEGSVIEWKVPDGIVLIKVKKVLFQPEALGFYHL